MNKKAIILVPALNFLLESCVGVGGGAIWRRKKKAHHSFLRAQQARKSFLRFFGIIYESQPAVKTKTHTRRIVKRWRRRPTEGFWAETSEAMPARRLKNVH